VQRRNITKRRRRIALAGALAAGLLLPWPLPAQCEEIDFVHIGRRQGLSQSTVYCIRQDRNGFMWFATENGLNRYDGYDFTVFLHHPGDPASLSHSAVLEIFEDREGVLWIGTLNGGLNRLDPLQGGFQRFRHDPRRRDSLSHDIVGAIYEDRAGELWIGTDEGLNRLDRRTGTFTRFALATDRPGASNHIHDIIEDRDGALWIATFGGGLVRFDRGSGRFDCFRHAAGDESSLGSDFLYRVLQDRRGSLWLCSHIGLELFDPSTGRSRRVPLPPADEGAPASVSAYSIAEDASGRLWVGTSTGLACIDPRTGALVRHRHDPLDPKSLGSDQVRAVYPDRSGIVWIGTDDKGIDRFNPNRKKFRHYRASGGRADGLASNIVYSFWEDPEGGLWIGTQVGVDRLERGTGVFRHFGCGDGGRDESTLVRALHGDEDGGLWLGTDGSGLRRLDRRSGRIDVFRHRPGDAASISHDRINALCRDAAGSLWIGTYGGGLNRLDRGSGAFQRFQHDADDPGSLSENIVRAILQDREGTLWVATYGGGLERFEPAAGTFRHYRHDPADPASLNNDYILSLHEDRAGGLWIGTLNGGLNRLDRRTGRFSHYTRAAGLASDQVVAIAEDPSGDLWLATNEGLTRFSPRTGRFRNYDVSDGLQDLSFISGSCLAGRDGTIYVGGANGFNAFLPQEIFDNPYVPPLRITAFKVLNRDVPLPRPAWETDEVEIGPRDQLFSIEFAALDYAAPEKNQYAYKLEGLTDDWIPSDSRRRLASFSRLRPGRYVFRVRGSSSDGIWSDQEARLVIRVRGPWWRSWWFLSLLALAVALAVFEWNRTRLRRRAARIRTRDAMDQLLDKCAISPREKEIVLLLLKGLSNKEIAEKLYIELSTVKIHVHHILGKLGVANRTQLLRLFQNLKT